MLNQKSDGSRGEGGGDVESNENTALLAGPGDSPAESAESDRSDTNLWDEMASPWPATFERSISLLASPVINANEAQLFTKSPKPGNTPIAIRQKNRMVCNIYNRFETVCMLVILGTISHWFRSSCVYLARK